MPARPVPEVLASLGGIATTARLRSLGVSEHRLRIAIECKLIVRPRHGVLALSSTPDSVLAAAKAGGALACVSAADYYGLWSPPRHGLHLSIRANSAATRSRSQGLVAHRDAHHLAPSERFVVSPQSCVAQCIRELPFDHAVAVLDSALHRGAAAGFTPIELAPLARTLPRRLHSVLHASDGRSEAGAETIARVRLRRAGQEVRPQFWACRGIRVDLLVGDRLVVEIGSKEFHARPERYEPDHERATTPRLLGFEVLEFTTLQVMDDWDAVEAVILSRAAH